MNTQNKDKLTQLNKPSLSPAVSCLKHEKRNHWIISISRATVSINNNEGKYRDNLLDVETNSLTASLIFNTVSSASFFLVRK